MDPALGNISICVLLFVGPRLKVAPLMGETYWLKCGEAVPTMGMRVTAIGSGVKEGKEQPANTAEVNVGWRLMKRHSM